jgi:hypothetical protein
VCTKICIYKLIPYQQGCVLSLLLKFDITSQKGEKELKGIKGDIKVTKGAWRVPS